MDVKYKPGVGELDKKNIIPIEIKENRIRNEIFNDTFFILSINKKNIRKKEISIQIG
ncbi:hypothetical protein NCCP2716_29190 [Sporosarcina sp. NCCP-2716]|nr:hypothetical protein NCCP2716_29190 [Sporosarcina sp. NCCP-2716]